MLQILEEIARDPSAEKRGELLLALTDAVLVRGTPSKKQAGLYGDIVQTVLPTVSVDGRLVYASRVADLDTLPRDIALALSRDQARIAEPILRQSGRLLEADLVEIATNGSDEHRLALACRQRLPIAVTTPLIDLGGAPVRRAVARNLSARIGEAPMEKLVTEAEADEDLCKALAERSDLPGPLADRVVKTVAKMVMQHMHVVPKRTTRAVAKPFPDADTPLDEIVAAIRAGRISADIGVATLADADRANDLAELLGEISRVDEVSIMKVLVRNDAAGILVVIRGLDLTQQTWAHVVALRGRRLKLSETQLRYERGDYDKVDVGEAKTTLAGYAGKKHHLPEGT